MCVCSLDFYHCNKSLTVTWHRIVIDKSFQIRFSFEFFKCTGDCNLLALGVYARCRVCWFLWSVHTRGASWPLLKKEAPQYDTWCTFTQCEKDFYRWTNRVEIDSRVRILCSGAYSVIKRRTKQAKIHPLPRPNQLHHWQNHPTKKQRKKTKTRKTKKRTRTKKTRKGKRKTKEMTSPNRRRRSVFEQEPYQHHQDQWYLLHHRPLLAAHPKRGVSRNPH